MRAIIPLAKTLIGLVLTLSVGLGFVVIAFGGLCLVAGRFVWAALCIAGGWCLINLCIKGITAVFITAPLGVYSGDEDDEDEDDEDDEDEDNDTGRVSWSRSESSSGGNKRDSIEDEMEEDDDEYDMEENDDEW